MRKNDKVSGYYLTEGIVFFLRLCYNNGSYRLYVIYNSGYVLVEGGIVRHVGGRFGSISSFGS